MGFSHLGVGALMIPHLGGDALLPYSLSFTGLSGFPAGWTAPNWAVSSNTAKNIPTVGSDLLTDGDMEAIGVASWPNLDTPTTKEKSGVQVYAGLQSLHVIADDPAEGVRQFMVSLDGAWYQLISHLYVASGKVELLWGNGFNSRTPEVTAAAWREDVFTDRATTTGPRVSIRSVDAGAEFYTDNIFAYLLTNLVAYRNFNQANIKVKAAWTIATGHCAGVIARYTDINNYLYAYHNRTSAFLILVTSGITTQLISTPIAYSDGANVEIRCNGNLVQLFYNNVQVGVDQTEITLSANTTHGLFSTDISNTCSLFSVEIN